MTALVENYDLFHKDQSALDKVSPAFLDDAFQTAIQSDSSGMNQLYFARDLFDRWYGRHTWGLFASGGGSSGAFSQADANALSPGSSAFNIPININVNVDKSGNVTATGNTGTPGGLPAGMTVNVNQGRVLGVH
jgi:hypothetical protein